MMEINRKQLLAGALVMLNLMVLTPTGFVASYIWSETKQWRAETDEDIKEVKQALNQLRADIPERYASKDTLKEVYNAFQKSLDRMNDRLTHMRAH